MNVLIFLLPIALSLGLIGLIAFLWSLRNGQYDDLDGAALRVLDDDDLVAGKEPGLNSRDEWPRLLTVSEAARENQTSAMLPRQG
jgi:cbb3-type cytochrome oxidase maturation protein